MHIFPYMGKNRGGYPYHISRPCSISLLWQSYWTPRFWHELTQFSSKTFRCVHLCSALYFCGHSTKFFMIWCSVIFPFLFTSYDDITGKIWKFSSSRCEGYSFSSKYFETNMRNFHVLFLIYPFNPIQLAIVV